MTFAPKNQQKIESHHLTLILKNDPLFWEMKKQFLEINCLPVLSTLVHGLICTLITLIVQSFIVQQDW